MFSCQYEGAESKSDECQTRNLEHFSQNAKIQFGRFAGVPKLLSDGKRFPQNFRVLRFVIEEIFR